MHSIYFSDEQMQAIWCDFTAHFKNSITIASYQSDLIELLEFLQKNFVQITASDVKKYFEYQEHRVEEQMIQPSTLSKKVREMNSLASYIYENKEYYDISENYENHFARYLKQVVKISNYANAIPTEHIDKLLNAAQEDNMAYCLLSFIYRMGLSSTEISELHAENLAAYDNGVYLSVPGRREACFVPEDVYEIVLNYLSRRQENKYLFCNSRGNKLNAMYISRLMKKYTSLAGIPAYSAEALRNSCIYTMFSYRATPEQIAKEMGVTDSQIRRYNNRNYIDTDSRTIRNLVKIKIELPQ